MTAWRTRRAGPGDADEVVRLEAAAFGARSWGAQSVRESLDTPLVSVLLAGAADAAPVGLAIWRDLRGEAELLAIGVAPPARRNGAGMALLEAVLYDARRAGATRLYLEVDAGADAARALYARAGFEPVSVRQAYYRDGADAVIMQMAI